MIGIILAQIMGAGVSAAQTSLTLTVGQVQAQIEGVEAKKIDQECLTEALKKVRDLYPKGLEKLRTELTEPHRVIEELKKGPHAILPLEGGKGNLAISLINDGNVIIPFEKWARGETYAWYSAVGKNTGISSCQIK